MVRVINKLWPQLTSLPEPDHFAVVTAFFIFCLLVVTGEKMTEAINVSRAKVDCRYFESVNGIKLTIFVICDNK